MPKFVANSIVWISLGFGASVFSAPVSLKEAFDQAAQRTEPIPIQERVIAQQSEKIVQIRGAVMPNLSLMGSYQRQHEPSDTANAFNRPDQSTLRFNLVQPIFRGFREFAEWRSAERTLDARQAQLELARLSLYSQVAKSYYTVLQAERDLENQRTLLSLTVQRVGELKGRVKIGRSRNGELLTSEAQVATLNAQIEMSLAQSEQARESFAATTGLPANSELSPETGELPEKVEPLDEYLRKLEKRPDIVAQRALEKAAEEKVDSAWGGHFPSIDVTGNYYLKRTGILENVKWDATVNLTFPLFQGGAVSAQVSEATEAHKEQALRLGQIRRNAEREIRTFYVTLSRGLTQYRALKVAVATSEENYKEQNRDYRLGLVTNLDVLQALNTFQESKRQLDRVYFDALQAVVGLSASVGIIP